MKIIGITSTAILSLVLGVAAPAYAQHEEQGDKQDHAKQQQGGHEQGKPEQQHAQKPQPQHAQPQHAQENTAATGPADQQQAGAERPATARPAAAAAGPAQPAAAQQQQQQDQHNQQQAQQQQQQSSTTSSRPAQQQQSQPTSSRRSIDQQQQRIQQSAWQQHRSQNWQSDHRNWQQRGGYRGYRIPDDRYRGYFGPSHGFRINTLPFLVVGGYPRFQYEGYWISAVDPWPSSWGDDWYDNDDVYVKLRGQRLLHVQPQLSRPGNCDQHHVLARVSAVQLRERLHRHEPHDKEQHMLGTVLIVVLILALLGALPRWSHSRDWGYAPTGGVGVIILIVVVLLLLGRI